LSGRNPSACSATTSFSSWPHAEAP
jgi:hypothetical protein